LDVGKFVKVGDLCDPIVIFKFVFKKSATSKDNVHLNPHKLIPNFPLKYDLSILEIIK